MTIKRYIEEDCPDCGAKNHILVWDTINAQVSPEAKAALVCGEINVFTCQRCEKTFNVQKSLLYHDMENKFMVWYLPFAWIENGEIFNVITPDGQIKGIEHPPEVDYAGNIQYVFDMDELVRYIKFRDVLAEKMAHASG
jgi:predicted RNA-binding Zn-ribbon protein involved in translation (DUF1610 family)